MNLFRIRVWGSADWMFISIHTDGENDDHLAERVSSILGSGLSNSNLHVQFVNEDGDWEDLE